MKPAPNHHELLLQGAEALGSRVDAAPPEWTGSAFNAEVLSSAGGRPAFQRHERDLPPQVAAFRVDGTPLLIGALHGPATRSVVEDQIRRYRNQATIARSWLGVEGPNLQLFLIGPERPPGHQGWLQLANVIEADDRVCRKLVWLFDGLPDLESALRFLGRTFVATPWDLEERVQARLDQMADIGMPPGWQAVVDDEDLDADGVVNRIIELEGNAE